MTQRCKFCERDAAARGLCLMHYKRERAAGSLHMHETVQIEISHNGLDLTGKTFGRLHVVSRIGVKWFPNGDSKSVWSCECDCGSKIDVLGSSLVKERGTKSCGCLSMESKIERATTHGMSDTRIYRIWRAMRDRCENSNSENFYNYGARGISVCDRWKSFENFLSDMGVPASNHSIDRINNDGNYDPLNCKWSTRCEQNRNKRNNRLLSLHGITKTLSEWANHLNICQSSLRERLDKWHIEKSLTTPKKG